jgi:hypothetical protein
MEVPQLHDVGRASDCEPAIIPAEVETGRKLGARCSEARHFPACRPLEKRNFAPHGRGREHVAILGECQRDKTTRFSLYFKNSVGLPRTDAPGLDVFASARHEELAIATESERCIRPGEFGYRFAGVHVPDSDLASQDTPGIAGQPASVGAELDIIGARMDGLNESFASLQFQYEDLAACMIGYGQPGWRS